MRIAPKGKCIRREGFGCPEGTPSELGCSPQKTATEICYDMEGRVISKKPLVFNAPYPPKSPTEEELLKVMGNPKAKEDAIFCNSLNPTWKGKSKVWSSPLQCLAPYEDAENSDNRCCKPIESAVKTRKSASSNNNKIIFIIGGLALIVGGYFILKKDK